MKRLRIAILLVLLAGSVVALVYRGEIQVWARGVGEGVDGLVGRAAPELPPSLRTLEGSPMRLSDLRGNVVLLHFWTYG